MPHSLRVRLKNLQRKGELTEKDIDRIFKALEQEPTDTVSRGVFEQVMRERDIAIEQLHELGYELGQKIEPCDDAVSREAVIEILGDYGCTNREGLIFKDIRALPSVTQKSGKWIKKEYWKPLPYDQEVCKFLANYMDILEKQMSSSENPNKWIPVSERLPKDEQEVLITYKINVKHHVWSAIWDELHCRFYDKKYRSYMSVDSVIAWMPLPEPYKPQESEE